MTLICTYHGGLVCGIKHVRGFVYAPSAVHKETQKHPLSANEIQCDYKELAVKSDVPFINQDIPQETYLERLDRLIEAVKNLRQSGCIEIVLAEGKDIPTTTSYDGFVDQYKSWAPKLRKRGFKKVSKFFNGCTSRTLHVFHKTYGFNNEG